MLLDFSRFVCDCGTELPTWPNLGLRGMTSDELVLLLDTGFVLLLLLLLLLLL